MSDTVDIKRVLSGSVSEVPIAALARKGFKQVKVLNQAMVMRLIAEAVEEVWARRSHEISEQERRKVIDESRIRFEELARKRLEEERTRIDEVEMRNRSLATELETQRNRASQSVQVQAERDQALARVGELEGQLRSALARVDSVSRELERLAAKAGESDVLRQSVHERELRISELEGVVSVKDRQLQDLSTQPRGPSAEDLLEMLSQRLQSLQQPSDDMHGLQESIAGLADKISKLRFAGGGDSAVTEKDADTLVAFLEKTAGRETLESNVSHVNVQQKKAGAVKGALDKLKRLQQQGGGSDG